MFIGQEKSPLTNVDCDNDCNWFKPTEKGKLHMRIHEIEAQLAIKKEKERK